MASFAEVAAQTESVIPLPSCGESMDCMRTTSSSPSSSSTFYQHQQQQSFTIATNNAGMLYDDADMQTEEDSHALLAQPTMTSSSEGALGALAALATSAAMQQGEPAVIMHRQSHHVHQEHYQPFKEDHEAMINTITPHQTSSSDDDSEAMPPPPPRIPSVMSPAALHPQLPASSTGGDAAGASTYDHGFTSILAFHNEDYNTDYTLFQNRRAGCGRLRSASNPEGMEKWDSYTRRNDRLHFVLPSSILEEELASTKRVLEEKKMEEDYVRGYTKTGALFSKSPFGAMVEFSPDYSSYKQRNFDETFTTDDDSATNNILPTTTTTSTSTARRSKRQHKPKNIFGTSPDSVSSDLTPHPVIPSISKSKKKNPRSASSTSSSSSSSKNDDDGDEEDDEDIDQALEPEELLRRARTRLLEDLSEGGDDGVSGGGAGLNGEKGVLTLPHSLAKYKEVYNKNGRIGIYTPAERAAIIQKFNAKRARRVWNKKIRYNCRKNLADRRMRVKGRFVKRAVEAANSPPPQEDENDKAAAVAAAAVEEKVTRTKTSSPPTSGSPLTTVNEGEEHDIDEEMPDVADEEAGFDPTDDMPYRRTRRYTIT